MGLHGVGGHLRLRLWRLRGGGGRLDVHLELPAADIDAPAAGSQDRPQSDEIAAIVLQGGNAIEIAKVASSSGVRDLRQSALLKVRNGVTSLAEINRVTKD